MSVEKDKLCKCLNCGEVMYDENPQVGAIEIEVPEGTHNMVQFEVEGEFFWGCRGCGDGYLVDLPQE
jgi:hypothetical protein